MDRTSIWFDSPLLKSAPNPAPSLIKQQPDPDYQDHSQRPIEHSPDLLPSGYKYSHNNPQSPWSFLIHPATDGKPSQLSIPGIFPSQIYEEQEAIEEKLLYSEEEEFPVTPPIKREEDRSMGRDINTTGKRTEHEQLEKKSRTKEKGLRVLSQKAYEVVQKLKNATYKQVATKLFQGLSEQQQDGENNDEQNIKRRVYDALNVLIALGVLKKDRKRVVSEKRNVDRAQNYDVAEEVEKLQQLIAQKNSTLLKKQKELERAQEKFQSIAKLMRRNRGSKKKGQVITFPFIGVVISQSDQSHSEQSNEEFLIKSETPLQPFGDIDALKWLHQVVHPHAFLKQEQPYP